MPDIHETLRPEAKGSPDRPHQVTRYLWGLSPPAATQARLRRQSPFGELEKVPFNEVPTCVERNN